MTVVDRTGAPYSEFTTRIARFDQAPTPPDAYNAARPVACEDCWARFPERYQWEPSLPPHNCTERSARRRESTA